jgi:replicative DNA helicase
MNDIDKAIEELESLEEVEIVKLAEGAEMQTQDVSNKIESGFKHIDSCIDGGFREGDFNIITGIPGEGKTTLSRMFTLNFAKQEVPTLWFSYEMTLKELWGSFENMGASKDLISFAPVELNDDLDWMFRHIDKAVKEHGVKAVFIDTLGDVVKSVKSQSEMNNYANYLAQICKDLRNYAIKNNIMIFAIAHAVKNTRSNSNETKNSDIANSNGIPAAATNIFHVWRAEGFNTIVKIGKSRRDGTKKDWQVKFSFANNCLLEKGASANADDLW